MTGWPALFGALGGVFLLFGLLSVLLLVAGAPTDLGWIWANVVIGVLLLGGAIATNFDTLRERMRSGEGRRIGKYGTSAVAQTAILLAILGALGFLANRYHKRFDASEAGVHSLSDQTQKLLASQQQDVQIVAFYAKVDQPNARALLDKYAYASEKVKVEYADPNARPDLVERYGIQPEKIGEGLLHVQIGEESVQVDQADEAKLTNAIVKLTRQGSKKVYFVTGHNERPAQGKGAEGKEGFANAAQALANENYTVESLNLETKAEVPDDADALILAGPTAPLRPGDADKLDRYLARGGALLAMVDPRAQTDVGAQLATWGVELGEDAVVDRLQSIFGQAMSPLAVPSAAHEITRDMREVTMFPMARTVTGRSAQGAAFVPLVTTSENAWGERDLEQLFEQGVAELSDADVKGPVSIGVAGTPKPVAAPPAPPAPAEGGETPAAPQPRLVVFGDADFASNQALDAYNNRDLFVNSVNWLLGDVESIAVRPARSRASRLTLSSEQFSQIRSLSLFVLPELIAVLGVWAWWSRRRAPGR
ncbi:MAG: hypothetical protein DCC71_19520 [Proteobacteria bacterium]|nr:MAG: hypothetical protein DCC71_19520 [Pseudomonadota bacterium]